MRPRCSVSSAGVVSTPSVDDIPSRDIVVVTSSSGGKSPITAPRSFVRGSSCPSATNCWARVRWGRWVASKRNPSGGANVVALSSTRDSHNPVGSRRATSTAITDDISLCWLDPTFVRAWYSAESDVRG